VLIDLAMNYDMAKWFDENVLMAKVVISPASGFVKML
jgi:hypothetical protein